MAASRGIASSRSLELPGNQRWLTPTRILIVDRERIERDALARMFTGLRHVCACCDDAASALKLLACEKFDLILADTATPENGIHSFLAEILRAHPDAAVILATSVEDINEAVSSLKDGAYDWIIRPFSPEEITLSVTRALEKRRLLMENREYQRTLEEQISSRTNQLQEAVKVLELTYHSTLIALGRALGSRDKDFVDRAPRRTAYARRLGQRRGLGPKDIREIEQGSLLYDIGKIGVPDALLHKHDLTEEEQRVMRSHPEIGYRILSGIKFLKGAALLILQAHEWYDGNGFPRGLRGEEIVPGARILAVADTFEELVASASGHVAPAVSDASGKTKTIDAARAELKRLSGTRLDPCLVEEFLEIPAGELAQIREDATTRPRRPLMPR